MCGVFLWHIFDQNCKNSNVGTCCTIQSPFHWLSLNFLTFINHFLIVIDHLFLQYGHWTSKRKRTINRFQCSYTMRLPFLLFFQSLYIESWHKQRKKHVFLGFFSPESTFCNQTQTLTHAHTHTKNKYTTQQFLPDSLPAQFALLVFLGVLNWL